ncbi:bifunctional hydroxymethylpyrimidine kinase/phosphomethylpyrimidine kinase [Streptococcus fryi]
MKTKYMLTIAGSDVLSGGGMQADLATFTRHGLFGFVAQTCMTSVDVNGFEIIPTDSKLFAKQLNSLADVPFTAIKLGLLPNIEIIEQVKHFLGSHQDLPIVLDPVLVFKENHDQTISVMRDQMVTLFPLVTLITPNLREAEILSGMTITNISEMVSAARCLHELGAKAVVIKGGVRMDKHSAVDVYFDGQDVTVLSQPIVHQNNNGAGCTFASSIASHLAKAISPVQAVAQAKQDVHEAIQNANEYGVQGRNHE